MSTAQRDWEPHLSAEAISALLADIAKAARMVAADLNDERFVRVLHFSQGAELFSDEEIAAWFRDVRALDVLGWRNGRYLPAQERQRAIMRFIADEADLQARRYMPRVS